MALASALTIAGPRADRGRLTIVAAPASYLGVYAKPLDGRPGHVAPSTAREALAVTQAQAVLDGAMFSLLDAPAAPTEIERYRLARSLQIDWPLRAPGIPDAPLRDPRGGVVLSVKGGVASMTLGRDGIPAGARVAMGLYPPLVRNGEPSPVSSAGSNGQAEWRAAAGILRDGRVFFAVAIATMPQFAAWLAEAGALWAGYSDGGGSAKLALADGTRYGAAEDRRVASWLYFASAPIDGAGGDGWLLAIGLGAVAAGALWYARSRR